MNQQADKTARPRARRVAMLVMTALLTLTTMILMPAGPAQAATCSGYGCDGRDPIVTGCASGTVTNTGTTYIYNSAGQALAYLELRYSVGCATNWGRITRVGSASAIYVYSYRPSPSATTATYGGAGTPYYGDQLYGLNMTVCAIGQAVDGATSQVYWASVCG